jgi:hypothetical protein
MIPKFRTLVAALVVTAAAASQIGVTVGPSPAPVGSQIAISIANDTPSGIFLSTPCPFQVRNSGGTVIYSPFCIQIIVNVNPGAVFTTMWNQHDNSNLQVAPGTYLVDVFYQGGGMTTVSIVIDAATQAAAAQLGPTRPGTNRNLILTAPSDGGFAYLMGASGIPTSPGIPTCAGTVPLELDAVLQLSLGPNPYFSGFSGILSNTGTSSAPAINVPNIPGASGILFMVAFVVLDPSAPCVVRRISAPLLIQVL